MKARLGRAEAVQSKVVHTLSALTESILHLDAFTSDMVVAAASAAAESRVTLTGGSFSSSAAAAAAAAHKSSSRPHGLQDSSRESAPQRPLEVDISDAQAQAAAARSSSFQSLPAQPLSHRRSVAGHEYPRQRSTSALRQSQMKRAMTQGIQSIYAISQRQFSSKRPSVGEPSESAAPNDGSSSMRSSS